MSITKTAQGTYRARIRDKHGKQLTKTFKLKADAKTWERDQLLERDKGQGTSTSRSTVAEFADIWLDGARNLTDTSRETYAKSLRYIIPELGDVKLSKLDVDAIDAFLTDELDRGLAPSTVHRHYRTLHRMCEVAVARGHLLTNPCTPVQPPRVQNAPMRFMTPAQITAVADAINPRYRRVILLAGWSGLRWGEIQALRPDHFDGRALTVIEQSGGRDVKTQASRRRVVLPNSIAVELADHIATFPGDFVFTTGTGSMLNHASFSGNNWKPALVKAGVDRDTRFHDLRHTAVALAIKAGAHPKMVADMMGHSSIRVTMDRYGHLFPVIHDQVAEAMDELYRA